MKYNWIDYRTEYRETVDSWLDDSAKRFTGCSDGFDDYYLVFIISLKKVKLTSHFFIFSLITYCHSWTLFLEIFPKPDIFHASSQTSGSYCYLSTDKVFVITSRSTCLLLISPLSRLSHICKWFYFPRYPGILDMCCRWLGKEKIRILIKASFLLLCNRLP